MRSSSKLCYSAIVVIDATLFMVCVSIWVYFEVLEFLAFQPNIPCIYIDVASM